MQRGSAIAVVAAAAGILVAGSAASVAVINAANSGTTSVDEPIVAASIAEPAQVDVVLPDPEVSQAPLPQVIVPSPVDIPDASAQPVAEGATSGESIASAQTTDPKATSNVTPKSTTATVEEKTPAPKATAEPTAEPTPELISARQARQVATAATPGSVLATSLVTHAGYDAYAVQIQRPDGSIVTGYVEATSGVAYDWVVDKAAPAPKPTATYDDDHDDDREDDDYDDDDDDDDGDEHDHDDDEDHDDD